MRGSNWVRLFDLCKKTKSEKYSGTKDKKSSTGWKISKFTHAHESRLNFQTVLWFRLLLVQRRPCRMFTTSLKRTLIRLSVSSICLKHLLNEFLHRWQVDSFNWSWCHRLHSILDGQTRNLQLQTKDPSWICCCSSHLSQRIEAQYYTYSFTVK